MQIFQTWLQKLYLFTINSRKLKFNETRKISNELSVHIIWISTTEFIEKNKVK